MVQRLKGHSSPVSACSFSVGGSTLVRREGGREEGGGRRGGGEEGGGEEGGGEEGGGELGMEGGRKK